MLSPQKDYAGPWERARQSVIADIEHITAAVNARWAATFGATNLLAVSGGGTGAELFTSHGVLVGHGADPVTALTGTGVLHLSASADPTASPVVEGDIALTDITTNDVVSTKHGFAPKAPADATKFLNGAATPVYAQVKDSDLALTDITTNNASATKHGFVPKLLNDPTKFYDSTGNFSTAGGMPVVGAAQTLGKRVCWIQKSNNANNSTMLAVGCDAPSVTGGTGVRDSVGYWATPQTVAGGTAVVQMNQPFARIDLLPKMVVRMRTPTSLANIRLMVGMNEFGSAVNTDTPATASQRGLYVRYSTAAGDGGWVVQTVNGSGRSVSSTILPIAVSTVYVIIITVLSTSSINVSINGTVVNVTTNIVTGVDLSGQLMVADLSGSVSQSMDVESLYLES